jgi:eukaryotic-like serine/threonine-protein kinase
MSEEAALSESNEILAGRYEIQRLIGEGSFAQTYLALDRTLNRPVAVKILRSDLAGKDSNVNRFEQEARIAASVSHPNIVNVFDFGRHESRTYMVMEWVDGPSLKTVIRAERRLHPRRALDTVRGVLNGLHAIHAAGIVHRDIKPHNILLAPDGTPKVADFGIASSDGDGGVNESGMTLGTAAYMAPEQARGGKATPSADIYATGVILY